MCYNGINSMPPKNTIKHYLSNGYYHIYNRGVEKRVIFQDEQDYSVFLSYLKEYLLPKDTQELTKRLAYPNISYRERAEIIKILRLNNFASEINLLAYCLMPNHFHFLVKQKDTGSIDKFINSLGTRYTMYFNRRYKRVGPLYQGVYKAVLVDTDEQLLHLSRYIHIQALGSKGDAFRSQPCSYAEYLVQRKTLWVKPDEILSFFSRTNPALSYEAFVKQKDDFGYIRKILIEDDDS